MAGHVKFRKKLTREQFRRFMADQSACVVVFEACGSASYCAREIEKLGHKARLIAVQYGKPFVKRQKNDAAYAEAVVFAVQRPEMRFVSPKSGDLQARAVLLRSRERVVHQRTALVNALRAILYEYGHVFPLRIVKVKWIDAWIKTLKDVAKESETSRRLQSMLGVGSLKELADEAFAPKMAHFCCGRDFAAWLGLVSRQHSKGGKDRMGRSAAFVSATKVSFRSERA